MLFARSRRPCVVWRIARRVPSRLGNSVPVPAQTTRRKVMIRHGWYVRGTLSLFISSSTRIRRSGPLSSLSRRSVLQNHLRATLTMHMQSLVRSTLQIGYLLSPSARSKQGHAHSATGHGQSRAPVEHTTTELSVPPAEPIKVCHLPNKHAFGVVSMIH